MGRAFASTATTKVKRREAHHAVLLQYTIRPFQFSAQSLTQLQNTLQEVEERCGVAVESTTAHVPHVYLDTA